MSNPDEWLRVLGNAVRALNEALAVPDPPQLSIDGTIQRFEIVIELFWKTLRNLLTQEGIESNTPREAIKAAYKAHWLHDEGVWLKMLKARNLTSHIYNQYQASKVYADIRTFQPVLNDTLRFLSAHFQE